ncbi:hypothetical protein [Cytobacillus dafuensis]|uniref:DUF2642 domain-containing protein n=1 Tax=Cytobacillus dafuensis TaxID=1742359 RepID=A0A5B8YZR7_CYTDA|nr:hypothetical protein [Cytobacillus dafuensis]QED46204.1 hypothetical protein FSZ17_02300 [Cytobacillus dafuensis]
MKLEKEHERVQKQKQIIDFCIPERCCPDRFPSPQLPSPTGCQPPDIFEKTQKDIIKANKLLLDLALADDRPPNETFQKVLDGLAGLRVKIKNHLGETIEGKVMMTGSNFVVLREGHIENILPFSQIDTINPFGRFTEPDHEPQLTDIDPCFRRDLTFHFGDVVSSFPELIHLFFRTPLNIYLLYLEAKRIQVKVADLTVEGLVTDVDKETIVLKVGRESQIISFDKITLITIKL